MTSIPEKFLPIGTVVLLKGGEKRLMITGFCSVGDGDESKVWDYNGCLYPEGVINSKKVFLFNHEQIEEISHLGLALDDEEIKFKEKLNELYSSGLIDNKEKTE